MPTIKYKPLLPERVAFIVVHHSASKPSGNHDVHDVRRWHLKRGFVDVGYHYVIPQDGTLQEGRPLDRQGAHVTRFNHLSVGICLIGGVSEDDHTVPENNFTDAQLETLAALLTTLQDRFPAAKIVGHRDMPGAKTACPALDVQEWWEMQRAKKWIPSPPRC